MKNIIEIIISRDEAVICCKGLQSTTQALAGGLGKQVAAFCAEHGLSATEAVFYLAEELLFFKRFHLPSQTANIREAVELQRDLLLPFADDCLYAFTSERSKDGYEIRLYAAVRRNIEEAVVDVKDAGFRLLGIFPESQRYVGSELKKTDWSLLMGGVSPKLICFAGDKVKDRLLCRSELNPAEAIALCGTEIIFAVNLEEGSEFSQAFPQPPPGRGRFNLLPSSYRRPDFFRMALVGLVILNLVALVGVGAGKIYQISKTGRQLDNEIAEIMPKIKQTEKLRIKEKKLLKNEERLKRLGNNFDLISFLARLTKTLPDTAYLDQLRLDQKTGAINIQGYTEDIAGLTKKMQGLGDAKLKSTRRRKNKTYFHVEISP